MKNKKIIYLAEILLIVFGLCLSFDTANAGCCTSGTTKVTASSSSECASGASYSDSACTSSTGSGSSTGGGNFPNPVNASDVKGILNAILTSLKSFVVIVAIIFIVIGGLMYMFSAGDEKRATTAKSTITYAVIGLAIVLAAPTFLREIIEIMGGNKGLTSTSDIDSAIRIKQIAINVLNLLLSVVGIVAIISLVAGGAMYLTSYGDEKRIETGKSIVTYSIIGIAVAIGSLVIVRQVATLMGMS